MKKGSVLLVFFLGLIFYTHAQTPFFQNYFLLKKSEAVYVNTLFQDRSGFIWYGTTKGLFKFNGSRFERFYVADSIPGNVTALSQDSLDRIWIGQKSGAIGYLEGGKYKSWVTKEGPVNQPISKILFDKKGILWFSTLSDGLYYYRRDRLYRVDEANGMPDVFVYDIAEDSNGKIWAGTDGGVAVCTLNDTISIRVIDYQHGLPDDIIKKIKIESDNRIWMATDNAGIINYDPSKNTYRALSEKAWHFGAIADFLLVGNQVWIGTSPGGLVVHDLSTGRNKVYNDPSIPGITSINVLLRDHEGNVWTGSKTGALRTLGDYIEYIETSKIPSEQSVTALTVDASGSIWWASSKGLFRRSVSETGEIAIEKKLQNTPYEKFTITSLYSDTAGFIWAGFYGEGVIRIDPVSGKITSLRSELRNGNVLNISGKDGIVWLATLEGAAAIDISTEPVKVTSYGSKEGLSSDYIYQVFVDSKNRVWFATDGKGADMMDKSGIHHFQEGLTSKVIYGFAEDAGHSIWANSAGEGLYRLDGTRFKSLEPGKALRENSISVLASDKEGNLVAMHDLGIDLYDVKRNKIRYLGDEVGIHEKLPNLNASAKDDQGRIYIGTSNGIVVYSVPAVSMIPEPLPYIEGIKVLDKYVPLSPALKLNYNNNYVTISYLGLWYQNPENLFYQTKLQNYDRDWISSRDHSVTYSSLPPGEYVFRLRISDTGDFSDTREVSMTLSIAPPFWQRGWFIGVVIILASLLAYSIVKYRERSLKEDKRILEMRVTERTLEIQRKTEEIQAQNEEIHAQAEEIRGINENLELLVKERTLELIRKNRALEEYAFITAHNLRAPVASVLGLINLACKLELDDESKVIITHLQTSAEKLDTIVRSITEAIEKGE